MGRYAERGLILITGSGKMQGCPRGREMTGQVCRSLGGVNQTFLAGAVNMAKVKSRQGRGFP